MKVSFIGAGNMASAIIQGIYKNRILDYKDIYVSNRSKGKLDVLKKECKVNISLDNKDVTKDADIIFLCVKPQVMETVIGEIKDVVSDNTLIVSIAAGKSIEWIEKCFGKSLKIIRVMPNVASLIGEGISAVCLNNKAAKDKKGTKCVTDILKGLGECEIVSEEMVDVVGQIAGASPAWISMVIEAIADGAVYEGMPRDMAYKFASAGIAGTGKLSLSLGGNPSKIKDMVSSPKGTTIEGIKVLEDKGVRAAFMDAVIASVEKSRKM